MPQLAPGVVLLRRGHPGRGKSRPTVARSVRLPAAVWRAIDAKARAKQLNVHQVMRAALLSWLGEPTARPASRRTLPRARPVRRGERKAS